MSSTPDCEKTAQEHKSQNKRQHSAEVRVNVQDPHAVDQVAIERMHCDFAVPHVKEPHNTDHTTHTTCVQLMHMVQSSVSATTHTGISCMHRLRMGTRLNI